MTIYIDLIFLENIFMNSIIIYATAIILKKEIKILRILLGSTIGATYACVYYISNMEIYSNIILKIILSLAIVYISFRELWDKRNFPRIINILFNIIYFWRSDFCPLILYKPRKYYFWKWLTCWNLPFKNDFNWGINWIFYNYNIF